MKAKIIIWILALILLFGSVNATVYDDLINDVTHYHSIDNTNISGDIAYDLVNTLDLTKAGTASYGVAGKINEAEDNNAGEMTGWGLFMLPAQATFNLWLKLDDTTPTAEEWIFGREGLSASTGWYKLSSATNGSILWTLVASGTTCNVYSNAFPDTTNYHMVTATRNGANAYIYIDGVLQGSNAACNAGQIGNAGSYPLYFGSYNGGGDKLDGFLDEIGYFPYQLNQTHIDALYNSGTGCQYPFSDCLTISTDLEFTATDDFNGSTINSFNVSITWLNGTEQIASTTNGTVSLINVTYQQNTTINVTYQATNYFSGTLLNQEIEANVSNSISVSIYQAVRSFNSTEKISGNALTSTFYTGTKNGTTINLTAATHAVTAVTPFYYNKTTNFIVGALTNSTETITDIYSAVWNITVYNIINSSVIPNYNIELTSLNYTWAGENGSTTNGSYIFSAINGTYEALISANGYSNQTFNFSIGATTGGYNITLYTTNSFNFTFKDEETDLLITKNITVELIGDLAAYNHTTTTGYLYVDLLTPQIYLVRYRANETYGERFYYFQLNNGSTNHITLYAVNNATASRITTTLYDETNRFIEGGYIKVLRYYVDTNSYRVVEIARTNFEGITTLNLVKNSEFYKFMIYYPFDTLQRETEPTYIYADNLNFQILLASGTAERYYKAAGVTTSLTFDDATNKFRYLWSDDNNAMSKGCLKVYRERVTGETLINETCLSSSTGVVYQAVDNITGYQYRAEAYAYFSEPAYYLGALKKSFTLTNPIGPIGLFVIILLTLVFIFIGYWNLAVAIILAPLPLLFGSIAQIVPIPAYVAIPLEIVAVIIAYIISRKS